MAATPVEPLPMKQSSTVSPSLEYDLLKPTSRLKAAGSLRRLKARLWVKGLTILRDPNKMELDVKFPV